MVSVSKQQYALSLLICPLVTLSINEEDAFRLIQFGESPIDTVAEYNKSSSSSPSHFRPLDWCNRNEGNRLCSVCQESIITAFYTCKTCDSYYHKECVEPMSKHPYHPNHFLQLHYNIHKTICFSCLERGSCFICSCYICKFYICLSCAKKPPLLEINHPKRHQHTLLYFPGNGPLICDVCMLSDQSALMYTCLQCGFVVHKTCVYFPFIIKISRHEHRLSFNSSLTPEKWLCGVCRGKICTHYGRYSCIKGCSYGVHSKCATRRDIWDGKELEGEPEDAFEDIKSFNEISEGIIQHFIHQNHHMRLDKETNRAFDENKRCQACTFPICDDKIYNCIQCDYILHQECAYLPRKKQHAMHPHPLSLRLENYGEGYFTCTACNCISNAFAYLCCETDCNFILDIFCASIAEPLDCQCHPHPLFLTSEPYSKQSCSICQKGFMHLNCGECDFVLCFGCAILPNKMKYKHDDHFLIFDYDKDASGQYLCDYCEKQISPKKGMYMCNDCNVTLHIQCLLGEDTHMLPRGPIYSYEFSEILPNDHLTRNICWQCNNRCQGKIVYIGYRGFLFCSFSCLVQGNW